MGKSCEDWHRSWKHTAFNMIRLWHNIVGILTLASILASAQPRIPVAYEPLSGIINRYESIAEIVPCDSTVRTRSATSFRVGDQVLMIQMKGARIKERDDSTFGTITDMNGSGCAEFLVVGSVGTDRITFTSPWVHPYDASGALQLVSVVRVVDAETVAPVIARPFNGSTGGVVVIACAGELLMRSNIDVSGLGFRGGAPSLPRDVCTPKNWSSFFFYGEGGEKGEGIATPISTQILAGRGPLGSGGGAGNGGNAGGAGGSNAAMGGHGGDANTFCKNFRLQGGYPGQAVDSLLLKQRVFLGGGGGGGHQNNLQGTGGMAGGGIVVIRAKNILSAGGQILSRGLAVRDTAAWKNNASKEPGDGAGGGGAGGTVLLDVSSLVGQLDVDVRGGNGGLQGARYQSNGPGGGGGGGAVILTTQLPGLFAKLDGGTPGYHVSPLTADSVRNSSWGATAGEVGRVVVGFVWKTPKRTTLNAWGGGKICKGDTLTLEATPGFMLYQWSNGSTQHLIRVGNEGTYSLIATDSSGCRQTVGGLSVRFNPTLVDVQSLVEFGNVDYRRNYRATLTIRSLDDDTMVVSGVTNSASFSVVDSSIFPAAIPPFGSLNVEIAFFSDEPREYRETIDIAFSKPCPLLKSTELHAKVNTVRLHISMPDTAARMGDASMNIPVYAALSPDIADLPDTHMRLYVTVNSLVYAPRSVTRGKIVGDVIDLILNERSIIIEIDSLTIQSGASTLTSIIGTVLLSGVQQTPLEIASVQWMRVYQSPILTLDDGLLVVDPACFSDGRLIRVLPITTLKVGPNPVRDEVAISSIIAGSGPTTITIVDILGNEVYSHSAYTREDGSAYELTIRIPTHTWEQGAYVVRVEAPTSVLFANLIVVH